MPSATAILSWAFTLLSFTSRAFAEVCDLCPTPDHFPGDESAKFKYTKGDQLQIVNCSHAFDLAKEGEFASCNELHNNTVICQCGPLEQEPFSCNLCGGDQLLPLPDRIVAQKTCSKWQDIATKDFEMDCSSWQKSLGAYCGCDISPPDFFDGFCRICDDKILPLWNQTVKFLDGSVKTCVQIEQDINTIQRDDTSCSDVQETYQGPCECDHQVEYEKVPPKSLSSHGIIVHTSRFLLTTLSTIAVYTTVL